MHKSWGNAIEFNEGADKIGVDVMRWMFAKQNPEQNILFGFRLADETRRKFHLQLWNIYSFFVTYALVDDWKPSKDSRSLSCVAKSAHVLDRWIISKLHGIIVLVTKSLDSYDAATASNAIEQFVTDLSQWYVRRSRDRVGPSGADLPDKDQFYTTLHTVLVTLTKLLAPFTPFLAEEVYRNLTGEESVHLSSWPKAYPAKIEKRLERQMVLARRLVEAGHSLRKEHKLRTRQPLARAWHVETEEKLTDADVLRQVLEELNIKEWTPRNQHDVFIKEKEVVVKEYNGLTFYLDTRLTPELRAEGEVRELIRQIQMLRKEKGCTIDQHITLELPKDYEKFPEDLLERIQEETLSEKLTWGSSLRVSIG